MTAGQARGETVLALDVGGTKIAAGLVDGSGRVLRSARTPTPVGADAEQLWDAVRGLLDDVARGAAYTGVGIGCGGPMRWSAGLVSPLNIPGWRDFPLLDRVRERYAGDRPARLHNDAVAVAVAEARWGAGRGSANVMGMVVSTGVGGGLVLGGHRIDGGSGNAGHVGHVVVEPAGPPCACGGRGCLEAVARGPAIAADAVARGWAGEPTALAVARGARSGDSACAAAFDRAGTALGRAIASAVALLDLDVVCIGGGVARAGDLLFDPLRAAYHQHARMRYQQRARIGPARLGPDVGLAGAAALVLGEH
ncbi:MAG TPA: ROK family protein [Candidatus Nanopelagicales bacterium]